VEVFFAQVTIFFDKLFQWLGFIFNWGDILRSHQAIAYTANQYLGFLPLAVSGIQKTFDGAIANIQTQIAAFSIGWWPRWEGARSVGMSTPIHRANRPSRRPTPITSC